MTISYLLFIAVQLNSSARASQDSLMEGQRNEGTVSISQQQVKSFQCSAHSPVKHHFRLNKRFQPEFLFQLPANNSAVIPFTYCVRALAPDQDEPVWNTYLDFSSHRGPPSVV